MFHSLLFVTFAAETQYLPILTTSNNTQKFNQLRFRFPFLIYQSYTILHEKEQIRIKYLFNLSDTHIFQPEISIPSRVFFDMKKLSKDDIELFVFHIGMVELISYWKCACPKTVIINPFHLTDNQINWWKKLYFNGLGEFFYLNNIETNLDDFMQLKSDSDQIPVSSGVPLSDLILVPIGGGKDSIVSLELLKSNKLPIIPFIVNPREATTKTAQMAGFSFNDCMIIHRTIDPLLLKLNSEGFLNGHTPFSSLLAFLAAFSAVLCGAKYIALSNESSANEATVANTNINHQYSKSFEFESDFRNYSKEYLHPYLNYFSLLRPLNELQIGKLFSHNHQYFSTFRSCNVGSKTDSWCCNCPKCLFTFLMLSPFQPMKSLDEIFGIHIPDIESLKPILNELRGLSETKPFECVGTVQEVEVAIQSLLVKNPSIQHSALFSHIVVDQSVAIEINMLLQSFDHQHFLLPEFEEIIKTAIHAE